MGELDPPRSVNGISQRLRALRLEFAAHAQNSCEHARELIAALQKTPADSVPLVRLARVTHDLAGSAGAFGYLSITEQAREVTDAARLLLERGDAPEQAQLVRWEQLCKSMCGAVSSVSAPDRASSAAIVTEGQPGAYRLGEHPIRGKVLYVEDQPTHVAWVREVLESAGYAFGHCERLKDFDTAFRSLRPDLLLVDVELPDGNGYQLAQSLRKSAEHSALPIVFLTGTSGPRARLEALAAGGDDFLTKPADQELLLQAVAGRVERARSAVARMERDGLTGLLNRGAFVERAESVVSRLRREHTASASLILLDIDYFKAVNDKHGHSTGDRVLRELAKHIRETVRRSDLAGRLGGEEFALVLEGARVDDARRACSRLLERFSKVAHAGAGKAPLYVTFSAGIAGFETASGSLEAWLETADRALYQAKTEGRNRVIIGGPPGARTAEVH